MDLFPFLALVVVVVVLVSYVLVAVAMNSIPISLSALPDDVTADCSEIGCTRRATRGRSYIVAELNSRGKCYYEAGTAPEVYCHEHCPTLSKLHPTLHFLLALTFALTLLLGVPMLLAK